MFIAKVLKDEAFLQQAKIAKLDRANKQNLGLLIHWLEHPAGGAEFLKGTEQKAWDGLVATDLISLSSRASDDGFLRWFQETLLPKLHPTLVDKWRVSEPVSRVHC